jgi:putative phage-type endonuclease
MGFKIVKINKEQDYEGWLNYRDSGIGASEVGTILGLNPWKSSIELFYQKLGQIPQKMSENMAMFMGNRLESFVADMWQYWDGDEASVIKNFNEGNKVKNCQEVTGYIVNDDYPHLFFSPDRIITKEGAKLVRRGKLYLEEAEGVLEIKTISGFASKQWEGGIPPSYIVQLTTYLIGLNLNYGEIAFLEDGRNLRVFPIEKQEFLVEKIIKETTEFWERVTMAKSDMENAHLYAPEPDGTESYQKFLNQKYSQSQDKTMRGNAELMIQAKSHKSLGEQIKELEEKQRYYASSLKLAMQDFEMIDFGESGKVTWKTDSRGIRTLKNQIK